jgi:exodeoxyribonuclease VII large subunit
VNQDVPIYRVSEITGAVRRTLESLYGRVRVRGEISNFRRPASGHHYFALKDEEAQLRAVMFRGDAVGLRFLPGDGIEVEVEGEISLYEPRGDLQILVRRMVPSGIGALMQAFEQLKRRLEAEGLFAPERKRSLPLFPRTVAIITSPTGAAVRDLIHVLSRRWPVAKIVLVPVRVQGEGSGEEIVRALSRVNRWGRADVIIVGRGGGSLEDLWAFNEEGVARAIAGSAIPVVSAVGHETDVTISDLVADVRAPTPSAGAELVAPDRGEVLRRFQGLHDRMLRAITEVVDDRRQHMVRLLGAYGFRRPEAFLARESQHLDELVGRLEREARDVVVSGRTRGGELFRRLVAQHPWGRVTTARERATACRGRLEQALHSFHRQRRERLGGLDRALRALDPTGVLARGYCISRDPRSGRIVRGAGELEAGDPLLVQFSADRIRARVEGIETGPARELEEARKEES